MGTVTNCGTVGAGCHGTGTTTAVTITVDSGSVATTRYKPGVSYTIKIHGTNSSSLNKFGFQFSSVSGTGTSQVQAGTPSGFPTNVASDPLGSLSIVEHSAALSATSPGVYDVSFTWKAPPTAVGNITLYCTLNAVNGNSTADGADISGNVSVTLTPVNTLSTVEVANDASVKAFPNPVVNSLHLQLDNAQEGTYAVHVTDINGRTVASENIAVSGASQVATINTSNWASGSYIVTVEKDDYKKVLQVVK